MNTTSNKLIAILSIVAIGLAATTASAKDKGNGGNNGGGNSNRSLSIGGSNSNKNVSLANKNINIGSIINKSSNSNNSNSNSSNNNNNSNSNKKKSSIAIGIGIGLANSALNNNNNNNKKSCHGGHCYCGHCYNTTYVHKIYVPVYTCFRPLHCFAWVLPGDTWTTISLREYNNPNLFAAIAAFNGLSLNVPLSVGQQIGLPEIHPNGLLKVSLAPAPAPLMLPTQAIAPMGSPVMPMNVSQNVINANVIGGQQAPIGTAGAIGPQGAALQGGGMQGVAPQGLVGLPNAGAIGGANAAGLGNAAGLANASGVKLPSFAVGSVIALDGQTLGTTAGVARLKFAGVALSANVIEWTASSVKIQLPAVELTAAMGAELEVLRADGSLAIKTNLPLTPAANKLALGN